MWRWSACLAHSGRPQPDFPAAASAANMLDNEPSGQAYKELVANQKGQLRFHGCPRCVTTRPLLAECRIAEGPSRSMKSKDKLYLHRGGNRRKMGHRRRSHRSKGHILKMAARWPPTIHLAARPFNVSGIGLTVETGGLYFLIGCAREVSRRSLLKVGNAAKYFKRVQSAVGLYCPTAVPTGCRCRARPDVEQLVKDYKGRCGGLVPLVEAF